MILGQFAFNGYAQKTGRYFSATPDFGTHYLQLNKDSTYWFVKGGCMYPKDTQRGNVIIANNRMHFTSSIYQIKVFRVPNLNKNEVKIFFSGGLDTGTIQLKTKNSSEIKLQTIGSYIKNISRFQQVDLIFKKINKDSIVSNKMTLTKGYTYHIKKTDKNFIPRNHIDLTIDNKDSLVHITTFPYFYTWRILYQRNNRFKVMIHDYMDLQFQRQKFFVK